MAEIARKTKRHPSDLTDKDWERIRPLMPRPPKRGRRPTVDFREILSAIRYMVRSAGAIYPALRVKGFAAGDLIDVTDLVPAIAALTPSVGKTTTTLAFDDGLGHGGSLTLSGAFAGSFASSADGHGGTLIHYGELKPSR